jgi:tetratricopeptide (TPR) repeat protein
MPVAIRAVAFAILLVASRVSADDPAADRQFSAGNFAAARIAYAREVDRDPHQLATRIGLIRSLIRLDRWEEALTAAHSASDAFPNEADAHALLSLTLMRAGQPDAAATEADTARRLAPNGYWSLVATGRVQDWYYLVDATNEDEVKPSDLEDIATYMGLKPTGHPHDLAMDVLPSRLPMLRAFLQDPPFHADTPERETALKAADRGESAPVSFTVPFRRLGDYIVASVLLEGQRFRLLYDTGGGSDLTLNQATVDRLRLPSLGRSSVYGVNGKEAARLYKAETLQLGTERFHSIPIETVGGTLGDFDGILGGSAFDHDAVTIDFKQNTLTLARGKAAVAPPPMPGDRLVTVPFHYVGGDIVVPVHLDGRAAWAVVDTGAENYALLSFHLARQIAAARGRDKSREVAVGGKLGIGSTVTRQTLLTFSDPISLRLDNTSGTPLTVNVDPAVGAELLDSQVSPSTDFELDGLLGVPFLATARRVTFDYPHHLLTLEFPN